MHTPQTVGLCAVTDGGGEGPPGANQPKASLMFSTEMELWWSLENSRKVGWEVALEPTSCRY